MEADPLGPPPSAAIYKKTNMKGKLYKSIETNETRSGFGLNLVMCLMCVLCSAASVYVSWREGALQNRLTILEGRVADLETKSLDNVDVLVEKIRRETETQFRRRVARDLNGVGRFFGQDHGRTAREAPECLCPPGKKEVLRTSRR